MFDLQAGVDASVSTVDFITNSDENNFEQDALVASMQKPVVVDFWSAKNPACAEVSAALEKAVIAAKGRINLVKVNIDQNMSLAQLMRLETVPTVYVFFQGKPVDGFAGNKPLAEIPEFVAKVDELYGGESPKAEGSALSAEEAKKLLDEADEFFAAGNFSEAMENYSILLDADSENMEALGGIGWCLISQGDAESVSEMLSNLSPLQLKNSRLKGLQFMLAQTDRAAELTDIAKLEKQSDMQSNFDLAIHCLAAGDVEKAVDKLINIISQDRGWDDGKAHKFLLEVLEALGEAHPMTSPARRKLSSVLFS